MNTVSLTEQPQAIRQPLIDGRIPAADQIAHLDRRVRSFVVERPVLAVFCALGIGYVVGRALSRLS